jgi:hypothetical protein
MRSLIKDLGRADGSFHVSDQSPDNEIVIPIEMLFLINRVWVL